MVVSPWHIATSLSHPPTTLLVLFPTRRWNYATASCQTSPEPSLPSASPRTTASPQKSRPPSDPNSTPCLTTGTTTQRLLSTANARLRPRPRGELRSRPTTSSSEAESTSLRPGTEATNPREHPRAQDRQPDRPPPWSTMLAMLPQATYLSNASRSASTEPTAPNSEPTDPPTNSQIDLSRHNPSLLLTTLFTRILTLSYLKPYTHSHTLIILTFCISFHTSSFILHTI